MSYREHPKPDVLQRFMSGEVSRDEARGILCHLLAGCPECVAVTRPLWGLAELRHKAQRVSQQKESSRLGKMEATR
ncbi:MAG TPA: hypothetical protein VLV54_18855 [Thermoanaerobaculia bacterium]|nr:hypothetical protein [Thermoanaerobaculia bacterium]